MSSTVVLRCSSKFSLQSKSISRCFCHATWWTEFSLKINARWLVLVILREKISSWGCLRGSGLKLIFHWYAQGLIFHKSLLISFTEVFLPYTTEKREVFLRGNFGKTSNFGMIRSSTGFVMLISKICLYQRWVFQNGIIKIMFTFDALLRTFSRLTSLYNHVGLLRDQKVKTKI